MNTILIPESKVAAIKEDLDMILKEGEKLTITDVESYKTAVGFLAKVTKRISRFADMRDWLLKPLKNDLKDAENKFKMMEEPYIQAAEPLREEANKFVDEYMVKFMERAEKEDSPLEIPDLSVRTEAGLAYVTSHEDVEIDDPSKVPPEYMMVNMTKVRAAIKSGERDIPGVKLRKKYSIGLRS